MSNFITTPINENGIILDADIGGVVKDAMSPPFRFTDVFVYSHGWWTNATGAAADYNRFSVEFTKRLLLIGGVPPALPHLPGSTFAAGVHWPSMLSEDQNSITNYAEALSFYSMAKRADIVGEHGVYALLRMILETLGAVSAPPPLRLHLLGHSFGCRVVCSALEQINQNKIVIPASVTIDAVLLQAAFNNDELEPAGLYGDVPKLNLRLLVTRSGGDTSLGKWYPIAEKLVNLFSGRVVVALGAVGPSPHAGTVRRRGNAISRPRIHLRRSRADRTTARGGGPNPPAHCGRPRRSFLWTSFRYLSRRNLPLDRGIPIQITSDNGCYCGRSCIPPAAAFR